MKTIKLTITVMFIATLFACSTAETTNTSDELSDKDKKALVDLNNEIKQINNDYTLKKTRGGKWLRWIAVTAADAFGYIVGGTDYSAALSRLVWDVAKEEKKKEFKEIKETKKDDAMSRLDDFKPNAFDYSDFNLPQAAKDHNALCNSLWTRHDMNGGFTYVERHVESKLEGDVDDGNNFMLDNAKLNQWAAAFDVNASLKENINNYKPFLKQEKEKQAWEITGTVLEGLQYVEDKDNNYNIKVFEAIDNSNLSTEMKNLIKNSAGISIASSNLWNTEKFQEIVHHGESKN